MMEKCNIKILLLLMNSKIKLLKLIKYFVVRGIMVIFRDVELIFLHIL